MFDVAFSELLLILVVALVVIGPQQLPRVARTAGLLLGKAKRQFDQLKMDIERDLNLHEFQDMQNDMRQRAGDIESEVLQQVRAAEAHMTPNLSGPESSQAGSA